jgi:hypothetical protein
MSDKFTGQYRDGDVLWDAVSDNEKERIGYSKNLVDGIFFVTLGEFKTAFTYVSHNSILEGWTRSYFLVLDDKLDNPGINPMGGMNYTRHEFNITSAVDQNAIFQINVHDSRIYPRSEGCGKTIFKGPISVTMLKVIVEWTLPG